MKNLLGLILFVSLSFLFLQQGHTNNFREETLVPLFDFDLETASEKSVSNLSGTPYDLEFICGYKNGDINDERIKILRAHPDVKWAISADNNFNTPSSILKKANLQHPKNNGNYSELFYVVGKSQADSLIGKVYFIETSERNHARLRIDGFSPPAQKVDCGGLKVSYEVLTRHGQEWTSCQWIKVGALKSHQPAESWCPANALLTQFDLDGSTNMNAGDAPIVGQAKCCHTRNVGIGPCNWQAVGANKTHQGQPDWCPKGSFIAQLDFDGGAAGKDFPIVGQTKCCQAKSFPPPYEETQCYWVNVGSLKSHQSRWSWCPNGTSLTSLDFDSHGHASDSPIVGRAKCCTLGK